MGKFEQIVAQISLLPIACNDEIAEVLANGFASDLNPVSPLSADQVAEIEELLKEPAPLASEFEVEAFFAGELNDAA
jgi:hypothetical protein